VNIGRFFNAGQAGLAAKRVYVFEEVYDAFMESLVKRVSHYELGDGCRRLRDPRSAWASQHRMATERVRGLARGCG